MRRLQTLERAEKRKKRNTIIISIVTLFILGSSVVGFAFVTNPNSHLSNNNPVQHLDNTVENSIRIDYQGRIFYLTSLESEIQDIEVEIDNTPEDYSGKILYVDIEDRRVLNEIHSSLGRITGKLQEACYGKCEENLPEKTCSGEDNLIVLSDSAEDKVYQEGKCIFIEGGVKAADAFVYNLFSTEDIT